MYFRMLSLPFPLSGPPPRRFFFSPSLLKLAGGVPRLFCCLGISQVVGEGFGPSLASTGIIPGVVELLVVLGGIVLGGVGLLVELGCVDLLVVFGIVGMA